MRARYGLVEIDGQVITTRNLADSVGAIMHRLREMQSFLVCTLNLDHLVKLRTDPRFRDAYAKAEIVMPDGFPIVAFARMEGVALERATGSDLILPLCREAAALNYPVYLIGSTFETLCAAGRRLSESIPGLQIAGIYAPPGHFEIASAVADEAIDAIGRSGARICLVALGAPKQELFAARAVDATTGVAFLGIGASLDFIAGTQTRCPPLFRRLNLEWAWRAASNPRRLLPRYAACAALFARLYAGYAWRTWWPAHRSG
jgi:N-acetylglucosaminyldiphosphoundecaprenol N-acetyl-beta-D-mannosaminyltransferase